ncbi:MAG: NAD(P)-dependent oxidoreductase [Chloroflexota bacterium]|nr:MAG: NAD(P)-dependent oxidoreductase [Chloroflexota bacterium]
MTQPTYLVTGALGCLGAWTMKNLLEAKANAVAFDLGTDTYRWRALMDDETIARAKLVHGDISDYNAVERVMLDNGITHVLHLAALQIPFCRANPVVGAQVNVVGTVNVLQVAAKNREQIKRVVYASSTAVYGPPHLYLTIPVPVDAVLAPTTLYGSYKQDNENCARVFFNENGVESVGIRPYVIYGVGRDRGATSSPTKAMLAAVLGREWKIPHGGRFHFQLADDAAKTFITAATGVFYGAAVFNLNGIVASVPEIIDAIERVAPNARGKITYAGDPLPYPEELDAGPLKATFGALPETPLGEGVTATMEHFRALVEQKRIDLDNALA